MSENWERWENEVVNGVFPLRRSVRTSGHSAVFLTDFPPQTNGSALLKLVPAIPTLKDAQLSQWSLATRLSHPCLVRLLDTGCCKLGGLNFLYVVTEYAEQTLAQILAQRALELEEFRKLVRPVLEGLSFLHRKQLVHGGLKPSNLLLFKERVKLASDAVRPAGDPSSSIAPRSEFDPPESRDGSISAAGDVWSLGVLIVEALTQKRPVWPDKDGAPVLPKSLPAGFVGMVLRCLNRNPARRPTVEELDAEINPMPAYVAAGAYAERSWTPAFAFAAGPMFNELPVVSEPPVVFPRSEVSVAAAVREPTLGAIGNAGRDVGGAGYAIAIAASGRSRMAGSIGDAGRVPRADTAGDASRSQLAGTVGDAGRTPTADAVGDTDRAPAARATVGPIALTAANEPLVDPLTESTAIVERPPQRGAFLARAAMIVTGVLAAGWGGAVFLSHQGNTAPVTSVVPIAAAVAAPMAAPALPPVAAATAPVDPRAAIHEELPDVPEKALATIRGRMIFAIRVTVDPEGRTFRAVPVGNRSSKYFARLCTEAAMHWRFAEADTLEVRKWLVHFEFTRKGVVAHAT